MSSQRLSNASFGKSLSFMASNRASPINLQENLEDDATLSQNLRAREHDGTCQLHAAKCEVSTDG